MIHSHKRIFKGGTMKLRILLVVGLVVTVLGSGVAAGAAPLADTLVPTADDFAYINDTALATDTLLAARGSGQADGTCLSQYETFLKYDLSSVPTGNVITAATLTLRSAGVVGTNPSLRMTLYGSTTDGWSAGTTQILWADRPQDLIELGTYVDGPLAAGNPIVFNETTQFKKFLTDQCAATGNKVATFVIKLTACSAPYAGQYLSSSETTGANAFPAQLSITNAPPTAIALSTFQAADPAANWPLIAGLGALVALAAGGVLFYRKRATTH
jgi:hypothetical protein